MQKSSLRLPLLPLGVIGPRFRCDTAFLFLLALLLGMRPAHGEVTRTKLDPIEQMRIQNAFREGMAQAFASAKLGNATAAEQSIVELNRSKIGTVEWNLETAQKLVHLAGDLVREGVPDAAPPLITIALRHLAQAANSTYDKGLQAAANVLAGSIHERFTGDLTSALKSYHAAILAVPKHSGAEEAITRLKLDALKHINEGAAR